nr:hypothetical protein CFP56_60046 [Quercus suber]
MSWACWRVVIDLIRDHQGRWVKGYTRFIGWANSIEVSFFCFVPLDGCSGCWIRIKNPSLDFIHLLIWLFEGY